MKNVEGFWQMLSIQMLLFVYMAIGYGLRKGKILKAEARDAFTEFVILVTLPCMIFESFQITLTVETLQKRAPEPFCRLFCGSPFTHNQQRSLSVL